MKVLFPRRWLLLVCITVLFFCAIFVQMVFAATVATNGYSLTSSGLSVSYFNGYKDDKGSAEFVANDSIKVSATGYWSWFTNYNTTTTLRFTNNSNKDMTLTYTLTQTSLNGGSSSDAGEHSVTVGGGKDYDITVTSPKGDNKTATITVSGISLSSGASSITFHPMDAALGTYSVNGNSVASTSVVEYTKDSTVSLPTISGYQFVAWMLCDSNGNMTRNVYSTAEQFAPGDDAAIMPLYVPVGSAQYQVGGITYYTWEHAVQAAVSGGGTIIVSGSGILPNIASRDTMGTYALNNGTAAAPKMVYQLPKGINLLIPFSGNDSGSFGPTPNKFLSQTDSHAMLDASGNDITGRNWVYRNLTVATGAQIDCYGNINVNGQRQNDGQSFTGVTVGAYGKLTLGTENLGNPTTDESTIETQLVIQSGGALYAYGYITGTGMVEVKDGAAVHEFLQMACWPGGTNASSWNTNAGATGDALFLLSEYYVQNIESPMKLNYGAIHNVEAVLRISVLDNVTESVPFVTAKDASEPGLFLLSDADAYILRIYDVSADRMNYYLKGGSAEVGSISITISGSDGLSINSANYILPLTHNMTLIADGSSVALDKKVALLPGSEVIIKNNATMSLANLLYIFDVGDYKSSHFFNRADFSSVNTAPNHCPVPYVATRNGLSPKASGIVPGVIKGSGLFSSDTDSYYLDIINIADSAKLQVDGTLNITGAGAICTTNESNNKDKLIIGTGVINHNGTPVAQNLRVGKSSLSEVKATYGLANITGVGTMKPLSTTGTYNGFYLDSDATADGTVAIEGYQWSTNLPVTVHVLDENSEEIRNWKLCIYDGFNLSGYYTDKACTTAATSTFAGTDLYVQAEACIVRNGTAEYYQFINGAIADSSSGDTVKVIRNVSLKSGINVPSDKNIVLDLNGKTVTYAGTVLTNAGTLSVQNGTLTNTKTDGDATSGSCIINTGTINSIEGTININTFTATAGHGIYNNAGKIGTIGGPNSNVTITSAWSGIWQTGSKASINEIGGNGGKVTINSNHYSIYSASTTTIGTIGGTNSEVRITQTTTTSARCVLIEGTVSLVGGENAFIRIEQNYNNTTGAIHLFRVVGTVTTIGGNNATIQMIQNSKSSQDGYGLITGSSSSKIGKVGGDDVKAVEIIVRDYPLYITGTLSEIGANVLAVQLDASTYPAVQYKGTISKISGGYFCRKNSANLDKVIPVDHRDAVIDGYAFLSGTTTTITSVDGVKYPNCYYLVKHDHSYNPPVIMWNDDGITATATATCSVCATGTKNRTVNVDDVTVEQTGTTPGDCQTRGTITYTATATYAGKTAKVFNTVDGDLGDHKYEASVTLPTCTAQGYTTYTCSVCGDQYVAEKVKENGHSFNNVGVCTVCGVARPSILQMGRTLRYEDKISVIYIFDIDADLYSSSVDRGLLTWTEEDYQEAAGVYTVDTASSKTSGMAEYNWDNSTTALYYYAESEGIAAADLDETYYYAGYIKLDETTYVISNVTAYSPSDYAYNMIKKYNGTEAGTREETYELCIALLNYIAAGQQYFVAENETVPAEQKWVNWDLRNMGDEGADLRLMEHSWTDTNMPSMNLVGENDGTEREVATGDTTIVDSSIFSDEGGNLLFGDMISMAALYEFTSDVAVTGNNTAVAGTIMWTEDQWSDTEFEGNISLSNIGGGSMVSLTKYSTDETSYVWYSLTPKMAPKDMAEAKYYFLGYLVKDGTVHYSAVKAYTVEEYIYNTVKSTAASAEMKELAKRLYYYERKAAAAVLPSQS